MTVIVISSGVTSVGINLLSGDFMAVSGLAVDTTAVSGSMEVFSGGVMSRTTLDTGSVLTISAGGSAVSGTVDLSSEVEVRSGGSVSNFTVSGYLRLEQSSFANQIVVGPGGIEQIEAAAVSGQVAAGGVEEIFNHGFDEFGAVAGVQSVFEGEASQDKILSGGLQVVDAGGLVNAEEVESGGAVVVSRFGNLFNSTVRSGGTVTLAGKSIVTGIAGSMVVLANGLDDDDTILSGGSETVSSGGQSQEALVNAGGVLTVLSGGLASFVAVSGREVVGSGGLDTSAAISSGGLELVSGGGADVGTVQSGGSLQVLAGGVVSSFIVSSGGRLIVGAGGSATFTHLLGGASATVSSGGVAISGAVDVGSTELLLSGARDQGESVGGVLTVRGTASDDEAEGGGQLVVLSGGVLVSATVDNQGQDIISNGGRATATLVAGSGTEVVRSGGVASGTRVMQTGQELVVSGGVASQLTVSSGGAANVAAGGKVSGLGLASGAVLIDDGQVLLGDRNLKGTLSGAGDLTEFNPTGLLVLSTTGAAFAGRAVISGGRIELATSGAIGSGRIVFSGGNVASQTLQIDAAAAPAPGATFANTISNFNMPVKTIDLRGLAFVAGASATLSAGTLTLHDGGHSFGFHLAGLVGKSFSVAADGKGGTQIVAHATATFTQAAAGLAAPGPSLHSPVSGYAREHVTPFPPGTVGGRR